MANRRTTKPKLYRIGQVARMTGIQPFVLRFWEKQFGLRLPKAKSGHRFYRPEDIQKILTIKRLLYTEGFTIKGARRKLQDRGGADLPQIEIPFTKKERGSSIRSLRKELESILSELSS